MAAKSILEVDVKDAAFKEFTALFEKYQGQLNKMPGTWGDINNQTEKQSSIFQSIDKTLKHISEQIDKATTNQKRLHSVTQSTSLAMGSVARHTASIAANILSATGSLLKWASIGVGAGLLGAGGGLWGIDRLAGSAGNMRRQSKGAGVTAAELQAATVSFGKYVDVESQLQRINEARNDVSKRGALAAAGLGSPAMQGMSNTDFQANALKTARNTFINSGGTRQGAEAHGLLELFSFEELTRLKNTTEDEIDANVKEYQSRKKMLDVSDKTLKGWQDLTIQLDMAGNTIKNVLIEKLAPLSGPLSKLSESFATALGTILGDDRMAGWIDDLGNSIMKFAKYMTTDEFSNNVKTLMQAVGEVADALLLLARIITHPLDSLPGGASKLGRTAMATGVPDQTNGAKGRSVSGTWGSAGGWGVNPNEMGSWDAPAKSGSSSPRNNPGNLRSWGNMPTSGGFAVFPSTESGLSAMGKQLQLYGKRGNDTIAGIISKYAPSSENNTQAYIDDVSKRTGFAPNQHLDLNDQAVLSKLMSAMTKHENNKTNYSPDQIKQVLGGSGGQSTAAAKPNATVIKVENNTGGNAVVSFAAMAH